VETLTLQIERQMRQGLELIGQMGGALGIIENGWAKRLMSEGAARRQKKVETGERPWVTVNHQRQKPDVPNTAFRIDPRTAERQIDRLRAVKVSRDDRRVAKALAEVDRAAAEDRNSMPPVLEAVRAYATVGEIAEVWRRRFGEFSASTEF
jgi:methylmalonyl-CoA mutase N-terminal domain/subunit